MNDFPILLISLIFIGLGTYTILSYNKKLNRLRNEGREIIATIVEISGMRRNRKAYIEYTVEGKKQTVELSYYSDSMRVGGNVRIYVDTKNAQDYVFIGKGPVGMGILFIVIGILMFLRVLVFYII